MKLPVQLVQEVNEVQLLQLGTQAEQLTPLTKKPGLQTEQLTVVPLLVQV
jgi:hypothetical protein